MAQALLSLTLLSMLGLVVTMVTGFTADTGAEIGNHILFALVTVVVGLFAQSMTMFFFIGTGKEMKEKVKGKEEETDVLRDTRRFKMRVFPAAMYAIGALMVTFILGGGVHRGSIHPKIHLGLSAITLFMVGRAYWIELQAMMENARLMERHLRDE